MAKGKKTKQQVRAERNPVHAIMQAAAIQMGVGPLRGKIQGKTGNISYTVADGTKGYKLVLTPAGNIVEGPTRSRLAQIYTELRASNG